MKLKYYLRGLGIGIIVTALLMGFSDSKAANQRTTAPDEEAKTEIMEEVSQTKTTEMIELSEETTKETNEETVYSTETETVEVQTSEQETEAQKDAETGESQIETEETDEADEQSSESESDEETSEEEDSALMIQEGAKESFLLHVVKGDDSGTVSRKLQNAGMIENAAEFDAFLMQHGYDKKISVGTIEIPMNSSWLEIAQKLAGK